MPSARFTPYQLAAFSNTIGSKNKRSPFYDKERFEVVFPSSPSSDSFSSESVSVPESLPKLSATHLPYDQLPVYKVKRALRKLNTSIGRLESDYTQIQSMLEIQTRHLANQTQVLSALGHDEDALNEELECAVRELEDVERKIGMYKPKPRRSVRRGAGSRTSFSVRLSSICSPKSIGVEKNTRKLPVAS